LYPYPVGVSSTGHRRPGGRAVGCAGGRRGASRPDLDDEGGGDDAAVALELGPELVEAGPLERVVGVDARPEGFGYAVATPVTAVCVVAGFGVVLGFAVAVGELAAALGDDSDVRGGSEVGGEVGDGLPVFGEP
jgi:hypothetical protein